MKHFLLRVGAAAVLVFSAYSASVAAPVTFQFEAEGNIVFPEIIVFPEMQQGTVPVIPIEAGDTLTGKFTFDPDAAQISNENPSASIFTTELQIKVGDIELSTGSFSVEVFDDSLTIGSFDTLGSPPVFEDFDGIILVCSPSLPAMCQPEITEVPGAGLFSVSLELRFIGDLSVLDSTEVPGDVNLWNDLASFRSISIVFDAIDPNLTSAVYFGTIGELVAVPEPSSVAILLVFSALLLLFRRDIFYKTIIVKKSKEISPGASYEVLQEESVSCSKCPKQSAVAD